MKERDAFNFICSISEIPEKGKKQMVKLYFPFFPFFSIDDKLDVEYNCKV